MRHDRGQSVIEGTPTIPVNAEYFLSSEIKFSELRNKINLQREYFTKEVETIKNKTKNLEVKNSIDYMGNMLESEGNRAYQMEERMNEIEDRNIEITQEVDEKEPRVLKNEETLWQLFDLITEIKIKIMDIPEEKERE